MFVQVYRNKNILQLYMVRTMLESVLTEKSGSAKKSFRKDIDTQHLRVIETFHKNSFFWKYMLNLNGNIFICIRFWQSSTLFIAVLCSAIEWFELFIILQDFLLQSKKNGKDQESIQSSTTLDPGYQDAKWESDSVTIRHQKREPRGQPCPSR